MRLPRRNIISKNKTIKLKNGNNGTNIKPSGLWYSCGAAWMDWIEKEGEHERKHKYIHKLEVNDNNILVLSTTKQINRFNDKYKVGKCIDWGRVSGDYSGIEFNPYFPKLGKKYVWYGCVDVASGCIWDVSIIKKTSISYIKVGDEYQSL
jgi:hypothetical protein